jgi:hypothetical protein
MNVIAGNFFNLGLLIRSEFSPDISIIHGFSIPWLLIYVDGYGTLLAKS